MKISIITLQNINNYGSMLQAIATQYLFEECGYEVEIVDYTRPDAKLWNSIFDYIKNDNFIMKAVKTAVLLPTKIRFLVLWKVATKKYLTVTKGKYYSMDDFRKKPITADVFCVGSDQVWNSKWNKGILPEFFLAYANRKKIAFCSSIGKAGFDSEERKITKQYLESFSRISVRENTAVELLKDMDIDSTLLLDPTLLAGIEFWKKIMKKRIIKEKYVFVYQLNNNLDFDKYVQNYADKHGLKLVRLGIRLDQIIKNGKVYALPNIETFLSLLYYSEIVITDSFHATAFSLNFNKDFLVIYPKEFTSRLSSIMELTNTTNRLVTDFSQFCFDDCSIDYQRINDLFSKERKKAINFIKDALEIDHALVN